jgi:hypothetical protein
MVLPDEDSLKRLYDQWKGRGVEFPQSPVKAVFGLTFVARDPDGHRLRAVVGISADAASSTKKGAA